MVLDLSLPATLGPDLPLWHGPGRGQSVDCRRRSHGRAIAQVSKDPTDYRFPHAIYKPFSGNDEVSVRFKPVAETIDEAGGIAVRLSMPLEYYVASANALEDNVHFYRVVKGKREQLTSANAKVANQRHTLALKAEGDRFTVSFDGKT